LHFREVVNASSSKVAVRKNSSNIRAGEAFRNMSDHGASMVVGIGHAGERPT
jgi:hypothetical protein